MRALFPGGWNRWLGIFGVVRCVKDTVGCGRNNTAYVTYDYKEGWKLGRDGSVRVIGELMWRHPDFAAAGVSFIAVDDMIAAMQRLNKETEYIKVQRDGRTVVKRSKGSGLKGDPGGDIELHWLVPLTEDLLVVFKVDLQHFTPVTAKTARWRADAEQLHQRIFESFRIQE